MKTTIQTLAALSIVAVGSFAYGHCGECEKKATATTEVAACAKGECDGEGCPIAAAMEQLPKITFAVGEEKTCCAESAAKLAKESGGHIHYVVGEKEFHSEADAHVALVEATEEFVAAYTEPHTCSKSGQLVLAGQTQHCEKTAGKMAEVMQQAMSEVKFTYVVGEEECNCPIKAGHLAKESGLEKQFMVGEESTCCEQTARLNLARAKFKAAVTAMANAQNNAPQAEQVEGS